MTIVLQTNSSENNALTKKLTDIETRTGYLREGSSIVDPEIKVKNNNMSALVKCNYMTIPEFGRSYFVKDITMTTEGAVIISGHCDVLSSFANEIKSNTAVIARQQNSYSRMLNDPRFVTFQDNTVQTLQFPNSFTQAGFVLITAGNNT